MLAKVGIARRLAVVVLVSVLATMTATITPAGAAEKWPGGTSVSDACAEDEFDENLSGIFLNSDSASGWAVQNSGRLYMLTLGADGKWLLPAGNGWEKGKKIVYPNGEGVPDAEDITMTDDSSLAYVCTERNDDGKSSDVSSMSILSYDVSATGNGSTLIALNEWKLTDYLPTTLPNLGLEAITWVPDSYLVANKFIDESTSTAYDPKRYPNHGNGLFFVGMESNGKVFVFALNHRSGEASLVTDFKTENSAIMALHFDRDVNYLWTLCDDTCNGQQEVYALVNGKFDSQAIFDRPDDMKNINNEGFSTSSEGACVDGLKPAYWADDSNNDGIALRAGTVACGPFLD